VSNGARDLAVLSFPFGTTKLSDRAFSSRAPLAMAPLRALSALAAVAALSGVNAGACACPRHCSTPARASAMACASPARRIAAGLRASRPRAARTARCTPIWRWVAAGSRARSGVLLLRSARCSATNCWRQLQSQRATRLAAGRARARASRNWSAASSPSAHLALARAPEQLNCRTQLTQALRPPLSALSSQLQQRRPGLGHAGWQRCLQHHEHGHDQVAAVAHRRSHDQHGCRRGEHVAAGAQHRLRQGRVLGSGGHRCVQPRGILRG
jgi:hypothetical protein